MRSYFVASQEARSSNKPLYFAGRFRIKPCGSETLALIGVNQLGTAAQGNPEGGFGSLCIGDAQLEAALLSLIVPPSNQILPSVA